MSRVYTKSPITADKVITPTDINAENRQLQEQFNKHLDAHSMPVRSFDYTKFIPSTVETDGNFTIKRGVCTEVWSGFETDGTTTAQYSLSLNANNRQGGWIRLSENITEALILCENTKPGFIHGVAHIDFERRRGHGTVAEVGDRMSDLHWSQEFSVWMDGRLIAQSGPIWPRRHTLQLPFAFLHGGGDHTFDIRFRAKTGNFSDVSTTLTQLINFYPIGWTIHNRHR